MSPRLRTTAVCYRRLPSGNAGLGSDEGGFSNKIFWTWRSSIVKAFFNVVFTLKPIAIIDIMKYKKLSNFIRDFIGVGGLNKYFRQIILNSMSDRLLKCNKTL